MWASRNADGKTGVATDVLSSIGQFPGAPTQMTTNRCPTTPEVCSLGSAGAAPSLQQEGRFQQERVGSRRSGQPWLQGKARWGEQRGKYRSHEMAGHGAGAQPRGEMEGKETLDASGQRTVRVQTLSWHALHSSVFLVPDGKNTVGPVGSHPSLLWLCVLALGVLT